VLVTLPGLPRHMRLVSEPPYCVQFVFVIRFFSFDGLPEVVLGLLVEIRVP